MNKGFSIITNFGCEKKCHYCISKITNIPKMNTDFNLLEKAIKDYKGNKINLSGGGDPLYEYENNKKWYKKLIKICLDNNKLIDVHTRLFIPLDFVNKYVISFDDLRELTKIYVYKNHKIRLCKVIQQFSTTLEIKEIINYANVLDCQLTFKALYGFDSGAYYKLKKLFPSQYFLDYGDYNIYYMPDNIIKERFL